MKRELVLWSISILTILLIVIFGQVIKHTQRKGEMAWVSQERTSSADDLSITESAMQEDSFPGQKMSGGNVAGDVGSENESDFSDKVIVAIDSGHGGFDPGKVSVIEGVLEKDINLSIAKKLEKILQKQGIEVVMTRTTDCALCDSNSTHQKRDDMAKRISLINASQARLAISIHQNSFEQQAQKGAQVFYYSGSPEGKALGEQLQDSIKQGIGDGNRREAKGNDNYYLLLHTKCPTVIVECGFLSNPEETGLLLQEGYQEQMAEAIKNGILNWLKD